MENTVLNFEDEIEFLEDLKNQTGIFTPRNERGSTPKLVQESGWQSDGQIGATGSKI